MADEKIMVLINDLQKYDNEESYKLNYEVIKKELEPTIRKLTNYKEKSLDYLHSILKNKETWSCFFALEILKDIKNEKSIPYLVKFMEENEEDFGDNCEAASQAITSIGKPAIRPVLESVRDSFVKKKYNIFLVGALTEIKDEEVYNFMKEMTENYIKDYKKYDSWMPIDSFIYNFDKQGKKDIISILENLVKMDNLSKREKIEIQSTIDIIRDPVKFNESIKTDTAEFLEHSKDFNKFEKFLSGNLKMNKKEKEDFFERSGTGDDEFEASFLCKDCNERQNIKTGLIWDFDGESFSFENEIMCKHCFCHNIILTDIGKQEIISKKMRILLGKDKGIISVGKNVTVEDKKMEYNRTYDYLLNRLKEEPLNGELYLRAANNARKNNFYQDVFKHYKKAIELNPKLIATYLNLAEIYLHRYWYYGMESSSDESIKYFRKTIDLFNTQDYDSATIRNEEYILDFIEESSKKLGLNIELMKVKIGRNDLCFCGSGKKYKNCCLVE